MFSSENRIVIISLKISSTFDESVVSNSPAANNNTVTKVARICSSGKEVIVCSLSANGISCVVWEL